MNTTMDNGGAFTDQLLDQADIAPGASALDVGCGNGDVSFRLARLVGRSGRVTGIDLNESALETARQRAQHEGLSNLTFQKADLHELPLPSSGDGYDLITCRRVLMYLDKPAEALKDMLRVLKPGGQLILQEHDGSGMASSTPLPLNEKAHRLIWDTVAAEGADPAIGTKLYALLSEAGATNINIQSQAVIQTPDQSAPTAMVLQVMTDRILAAGTATREEIDALDLDTLDERRVKERQATQATLISEMIFGALAQKTY